VECLKLGAQLRPDRQTNPNAQRRVAQDPLLRKGSLSLGGHSGATTMGANNLFPGKRGHHPDGKDHQSPIQEGAKHQMWARERERDQIFS